MNPLTIFLLIIILVLSALLFVAYREARRNKTGTAEEIAGICSSALDQTVRKNDNKEKTLEFLRQKGQATNNEIRDHLGISARSAVRYLDELEAEGTVIQEGSTGKSVFYKTST